MNDLITTKEGMALKIGVMGSASGDVSENPEGLERSREVGRAVAKHGCIMVTGACPGLPYAAAKGAFENGGFVLGVSPAFSHKEHVKDYKSPDDAFSMILYSGMGFMERDIVNIRSSDGLLFLGGGMGTLNEFTVAFEEGKPLAILENIGGVSQQFKQIIEWCDRPLHENIFFDSDPQALVEKLIQGIHDHPSPVYEDARVTQVKFGKARG